MLLSQSKNLLMRLVQALKALLEAGADVNTSNHAEGLTALHWAAMCNYKLVADVLIEYGASTAICDIHGHTAAYVARMLGYDVLSASLPPPSAAEVSTHSDQLTGSHNAELAFAPGLLLVCHQTTAVMHRPFACHCPIGDRTELSINLSMEDAGSKTLLETDDCRGPSNAFSCIMQLSFELPCVCRLLPNTQIPFARRCAGTSSLLIHW